MHEPLELVRCPVRWDLRSWSGGGFDSCPRLPSQEYRFRLVGRRKINEKTLRILFLTSAHNSLSQRLWIELGALGDEIRVCVVATDEAMIAAVSREVPDLIIAPMLKIALPREVWSRHLCLIVHPGIKGDRGPSSLDWAIANHEKIWGVTILEATDEFDAGPIWASHEFALEADPPAKSSLYRGQVTEAALRGVLEAVARIESGEFRSGSWQPKKLTRVSPYGLGCLRPPMRQAHRAIDWIQDRTAMIVRKIRAADSAPGVLGTLLGKTCFIYGAHEEERLNGPPGRALAQRDGAVCIGTVDGAVWISHLKAKDRGEAQGEITIFECIIAWLASPGVCVYVENKAIPGHCLMLYICVNIYVNS